MKPKINSTINLNMEKIRELTELITKITEIQIKEISDSWLKAKEILKTIEAEKNGPPKNVARQGGET